MIITLLFVYSRLEQKYIKPNGSQIFFTVGEESYNYEKRGARMYSVVLDWNWSYQYELMIFNIFISVSTYS